MTVICILLDKTEMNRDSKTQFHVTSEKPLQSEAKRLQALEASTGLLS